MKLWGTPFDDDGNRLCLHGVGCYGKPDDGSLGVDGLCLVKDKVPYAIVDWLVVIEFDALQRVTMVTDQSICAGIDQLPGCYLLLKGRLCRMFPSPMQGDDNTCRRFVNTYLPDAVEQ